jgi:transposase
MGTARIHEGVRQMCFEGLLDRQTATVLGVSVRTFQRWAERYEEDGADGLKDGRLNRPSPSILTSQ